MRAPFQILAIPYRVNNNGTFFCVMHRSDEDVWQFVAGGGEYNETPVESAKREIFEETGISAENIIHLTSSAYVPAECISESHRRMWPKNMYVIPEYSFAFECIDEILLSSEHTKYSWLSYDKADKILSFDSNRTALYELNCLLKNQKK